MNDSLQSAGVALVTSSVTGLTDFLTLANTPGTTQMPNWSNTCNNVLSSVMSVVDDASTYIILNNRK